ncbi:unnamed protein product [Lota lota]
MSSRHSRLEPAAGSVRRVEMPQLPSLVNAPLSVVSNEAGQQPFVSVTLPRLLRAVLEGASAELRQGSEVKRSEGDVLTPTEPGRTGPEAEPGASPTTRTRPGGLTGALWPLMPPSCISTHTGALLEEGPAPATDSWSD